MDAKLRSIEDECKIYKEFEEILKSRESNQETDQEIVELNEKLEALKTQEQELLKQIEEVDEESKSVELELQEQSKQLTEIDAQEALYWKEYNNLKLEFFKQEDSLQSLSNQIRYRNHHLDKLKKTNLLNITFHIWHCGHFGTINGFRLGRLPTVPVEWSEINAAFGQSALLLHCLAKKINLTFERYRLVPYGNYSFLESLTDPSKQLPLYGQGGFRFTWSTKFDNAIMAFLDCLLQFKQQVDKMDDNFRLPYRMTDKGKIEDTNIQGNSYSIKIQFNSEEQWTKAMKYMLTNLKWILAWIATRDAP
jgi:beclin 1